MHSVKDFNHCTIWRWWG